MHRKAFPGLRTNLSSAALFLARGGREGRRQGSVGENELVAATDEPPRGINYCPCLPELNKEQCGKSIRILRCGRCLRLSFREAKRARTYSL